MKNIFSALLLAILLISASGYAQSAIQSGKFNVDPSTAGYNLNTNTGERSVTVEVNFAKPFSTKPVVVPALTSIDMDKTFNGRYRIEAISVSRDGFSLKVTTWGDSKIFSLGGTWIAYTE